MVIGLLRPFSKEPGPYMVGNGPQAIQADFLDVDTGHAGNHMPHYSVDSMLVASFVGPSPESVAECIKTNAFALYAKKNHSLENGQNYTETRRESSNQRAVISPASTFCN
jgi:hypothetical protein